jgi:hypothetical protein
VSKTEESLSIKLLTFWEFIKVTSEHYGRKSKYVSDCPNSVSCKSSSVLSVHDFLARTKITTIPHHPYSPDFLPYDHSLFQKPNMAFKRKRFNDIIMIQAKLWAEITKLKTMHFSTCLKTWQNFCAYPIKFQGY